MHALHRAAHLSLVVTEVVNLSFVCCAETPIQTFDLIPDDCVSPGIKRDSETQLDLDVEVGRTTIL